MLEVNHLTKKFGKTIANDDLNFTIPTGCITVMLGPNGAGKSTAMKSIMGLLRHDGWVKMNGLNTTTPAAKKLVGYVPEMPALYPNLTVDEHLEFIARAYRLKNYTEYKEELLERMQLTDKKKKFGDELSKGMQQKLSLCIGLLPKPKFILFDEPMIGLDPHAIRELKEMFKELRAQGVSLLISTHIIDSVDELWDQTLIMKDGKVLAQVTKDSLKKSGKTLEEIYFELTEEEIVELKQEKEKVKAQEPQTAEDNEPEEAVHRTIEEAAAERKPKAVVQETKADTKSNEKTETAASAAPEDADESLETDTDEVEGETAETASEESEEKIAEADAAKSEKKIAEADAAESEKKIAEADAAKSEEKIAEADAAGSEEEMPETELAGKEDDSTEAKSAEPEEDKKKSAADVSKRKAAHPDEPLDEAALAKETEANWEAAKKRILETEDEYDGDLQIIKNGLDSSKELIKTFRGFVPIPKKEKADPSEEQADAKEE